MSKPPLPFWARLVRFPPSARTSPPETVSVLKFCVGKTFRVTGISDLGLVGLDVSPEVDRKFGGFMHEVWVEPDCIVRDVPRLNRAPGRPSFGDAVHLAYGGFTMGQLKALGGKKVLGMLDSLTIGPASPTPAKHAELRATFWRQFYRSLPRSPGSRGIKDSSPRNAISTAADLRDALRGRRSGTPIVLWAGSTWAELLFVWWACDALERCRVPAADVWVVSATEEVARHFSRPLKTIEFALDEEMLRLFAFSVRAGPRRASSQRGTTLDCLRQRRTRRPPATEGLGSARTSPGPHSATAASLIPQIHKSAGQSTLRLSRYDEQLLGLFENGEWSTVMGRLKDSDSQKAFMSLMSEHGDLLIPARLVQWASGDRGILESRAAANSTSFMNAVEYRLSPRGQALLQEGVRNLEEYPEIAVGGLVAYGPAMRFLFENRGQGWRFVPAPSLRQNRSRQAQRK